MSGVSGVYAMNGPHQWQKIDYVWGRAVDWISEDNGSLVSYCWRKELKDGGKQWIMYCWIRIGDTSVNLRVSDVGG